VSVLSVLCGAVTPTSFWVRARITGTRGRVLVSKTSNLADATAYGPTVVGPAGVLSIRVTGLAPDTPYWYWVEDTGTVDTGKVGRTPTFPIEGAPRDLLMWIGGCARGTDGTNTSDAPVFDTIRGYGARFGMHLGDLGYPDIAVNDPALFHSFYDQVFARPRQQALYLSAPFMYVWDDHDYGPNDSNAASPSRAAAVQAYKERFPHYPLLADDGTIGQTTVFGRTRIVMLDCRAGRTSTSMLGAAQKAAFKKLVTDFTEPVMILSVQVPWIGTASDTWGAVAAERLELAQHIVDSGKKDRIFFLAGDMHANAYDNGTNNTYAGLNRPVLQVGGLDSTGSSKGGPYSAGSPVQSPGAYGLVRITDTGGASIGVRLEGRKETTGG